MESHEVSKAHKSINPVNLPCQAIQFLTRLSLGIPPPPPPGGLPRMPPPPFVNPNPPVAPPMSSKRDAEGDDMAGKKSRTEPAEANLVPENEFLSSNPNPVTFGVQIPHMPDKAEWKLDGNTIRLTLPLTDQVRVGTGAERATSPGTSI